jgi:peptidoglycan/LPS O-acetylase OafA/YrhL
LIAATLVAAVYMAMSTIRRDEGLGWLTLLPAALLALPDPSGTLAPDPFPLLPVVWSLFFELFANFLYAASPRWLSMPKLVAAIAGSGALLLFAMIRHGNGELGNTYATLWAGFPRVLFSFLTGVLFFRLYSTKRLVSFAVSPILLACCLLSVLAVPHDVPWFYDASCIFLMFPLILIAAMNSEPATRWTLTARFSADLSYPLYLFHLPLMLWLGFVLTHFAVSTRTQHVLELVAVPTLAYAAYLFFDRPMQAFLKTRLAGSFPRASQPSDAPAL